MMIRQLSYANRYNRFVNDENMLVFTTHSPYSLAIINTMIMGAKAYAYASEEQKNQIETILPAKYDINETDIAAYRLSSAEAIYCQSVINPKTGSSIIAGGVCDGMLLTGNEMCLIEFKTNVSSSNYQTILQRANEAGRGGIRYNDL